MSDFSSFATVTAVKSAVVLSIAASTVFVLRRRGAAARHQAWVVGLLLAAVLPAGVLSLPALNLPFPSMKGPSVVQPEPMGTARSTPKPIASAALDGQGSRVVSPEPVPQPRPARARANAPSPATIFTFLWALGSLALLARLGAGMVRARALVRSGSPLDLPELRQIRGELALEREVRLLESRSVLVPMTSGVVRPVLVVPAGFATWSAERRRLVLLHELAHVRRRDWIVQLLSEIALALQWFQPLAWLAARRLREEAEVAADDVVVGAGVVPSTYASHLLAIVLARPARHQDLPLAVAMGVTPLERRLRRLLAPGRRPGAWRGRHAVPILAVAVTALLAAARLGAAPPEKESNVGAEAERSLARASDPGVSADVAASALGRYVLEVAQNVNPPRERHEKARDRDDAGAADLDRGERSFERAQELHGEGDYEHASQLWEEAARLGYRKPTAMYNLACSLARLKETDRALLWLERAIDEGFDVGEYLDRDRDLASLRSDARFQKLRQEYGGGDRERALERLAHLEETSPKDFDAWYGLGKELHGMGEYDAAIRAWKRSLEIAPGNPSASYNIACAQALKGDTRGALDSLERAIDLGFGDAGFLEKDEDLESLRSQERYQELLETSRTLELPDGAGSWSGSRPSRSEWSEAKTRYEGYLKTHPDSGRAWFDLGFAHLRLGESQAAADAYERAFSLGHRPGPTAYNVACSYAQKGDRDKAFSWLDRAREAGFDDEGMLASDPDLDNLRDDPRFPKLPQGTKTKWKVKHETHEARSEERHEHARHEAI